MERSNCHRYKLIISYDGTDFDGWQSQKSSRAVADVMSATFADTFGVVPSILGASRTDAGVHAVGQVACITTPIDLPADQLMRAWNNALPQTIVITSCERTQSNYNPHIGVVQKTYWYHFFTERPLPFVTRYGWFFPYKVDLEKLQECLQQFVGTHDFRSFCTGDGMGENTVRTIESIRLEFQPELSAYRIVVIGPRFMRHMIRRIVGAALYVASRTDSSVDYIQQVFKERSARQTLPNAPAKGLCLYRITYIQDEDN